MERHAEEAVNQGDPAAKFAVSRMSCGDISDFFKGLSDRIGNLFLDFKKAMEAEHCHMQDSKAHFTTKNYGIRTCAHDEWQIVLQEGRVEVSDPTHMRYGRRIPKIDELLELSVTKEARLTREEVIAVVMYTGPMYEKYNCVLRQWPKEAYDEMVSKGSTFSTTIHVLVSAVQKLSAAIKLPDGTKLYRGLGGFTELPESFFKPHANGGRGFTEWGFMSTTSSKNVAIHYASMGRRSNQVTPHMVLELTVNAVDRGACIRDLSQYPHEVEFLWVPCSFVAPVPGISETIEVTEEYGVVCIAHVEVNSNQSVRTLEHLLASKKQTHMAAFRYCLQELQRDLVKECEERGGPLKYAADPYKRFRGKEYTCESLIENIMAECKLKFEKHDQLGAEDFAEDETFRSLVTEMLNVRTMAMSKLRLWLEDPSRYIMSLDTVCISDAHQQLLGFLRKRMQHEDPKKRADTVLQICKLKGLLDRDVDGVDGLNHWETRLISAAAEGMSRNNLELLLEAGSVKRHGEVVDMTSSEASDKETREKKLTILSRALMKSAEFGHLHCIEVLMENEADIHFSYADGVTSLCKAAQNGHADTVTKLLSAGADSNVVDSNGDIHSSWLLDMDLQT
jgi:hypothetical protein